MIDEFLEDIADGLNNSFYYTKIKNRFLFFIYHYLKKHGWDYKVVVFEDEDENRYYDIVTIMFTDDKGYFRVYEIPYPIVAYEAHYSSNDVVRKVAKELMKEADEGTKLPRLLWRKFPLREIYESISRKSVD